jgi:hypothetical protein
VSQKVCAAVPHRQLVFKIPKRLRIYFRFERRLLGELWQEAPARAPPTAAVTVG